MPVEDSPTTERIEGPTSNGGVASMIHYQDDDGQPVPRDHATRCEIVELDAEGDHVGRTYGSLTPGEGPISPRVA